MTSLSSRKNILVLVVKNYTKADIKVSCPAQICLISWHCFINFVSDCLSKSFFFVTYPSLLQLSRLWSFLNLLSLSQGFNANITWMHCAKVLNWTVIVNTIFLASCLFVKKCHEKAFNFGWWCFFDRTFFLSKKIVIFSNLNYYGIYKEDKKKIQSRT